MLFPYFLSLFLSWVFFPISNFLNRHTIHSIAENAERIIIFLVFHFHLLTNIHLAHLPLLFNESICNYQSDSWWDLFSLEIFILFAFSLMNLNSHQTITILLQSKRLNQLTLTPLVITVYLSNLSNPTPSHTYPLSVCQNVWRVFFDSLIKSTRYLLIFRQNSTIFEGSPNSLTESYFTEVLRLGES